MRVQLITDYQKFLELEQQWNSVIDRSDENIFWLRHEQLCIWFETMVQASAIGSRRELFILLVYDGEELIAIAPLVRTKIKLFGIPVRAISFMHQGRREIVILRNKEEVLNLLFGYLRQVKHIWLNMLMVPKRSEHAHLIEGAAASNGLLVRRIEPRLRNSHLYISLVSDWAQYEKTLSKQHKDNINRAERKLSELGRLEYEQISPTADLEAVIGSLTQVELNSWRMNQGARVTNVTSGRSFNYAARFIHESAKRGYLRVALLKLNDAPIAYYVYVSYKNHYLAIWTGYDTNYRKYSPGQLMLRYVLKSCFETKHEQFDFLGYFEYETRWTNSFLQHEDIKIYRSRLMYALDTWLSSKFKPHKPREPQTMREFQT